MKRIFVTLHLLSLLASAGPSPQLKFERVSGTVKAGLWVEKASVTYSVIPKAGDGRDAEGARSESMLVLLLDGVQGIGDNERSRMSNEFLLSQRNMPMIPQRFIEFSKWLKSNDQYMLWISKVEESDVKKIKLETRVEFKGVTYFADDWGGDATCEQTIIVTNSQSKDVKIAPPRQNGDDHNAPEMGN